MEAGGCPSMALASPRVAIALALLTHLTSSIAVAAAAAARAGIPSTLDGPFAPVTVPFDAGLRGNAVDLPDTDPRVRRRVGGFEPEQISLALSANYDSVWISWVTGWCSFVRSVSVSMIQLPV